MSGPIQDDDNLESDVNSQVEETQETADNPAWAPYREMFENDDALRPLAPKIYDMLKPQLSEQDKKYQELSEKNARYKDYDEFLDAGIPAQWMKQSVQTFNALNNNPTEFHKILSENLGITIAEAKEIVEDLEEAEEDGNSRQLTALQAQIEELRSVRQQDEEKKEVDKWSRVIDEGLIEAKKAHAASNISGIPFNEKRIFEILHNQPRNKQDLNPIKAYESWAEEVNMYRGFPTAASRAPRVTPSGGGGTSLPLNENAGSVPDEIARKGMGAVVEWAKKNVLPQPQ